MKVTEAEYVSCYRKAQAVLKRRGVKEKPDLIMDLMIEYGVDLERSQWYKRRGEWIRGESRPSNMSD